MKAFDCNSSNEHIHDLLRHYGLRSSLLRLKVIAVLQQAAAEGQALRARDVHSRLQTLELTAISIREVLKRLSLVGLLVSHDDRRYSLAADALGTLAARPSAWAPVCAA